MTNAKLEELRGKVIAALTDSKTEWLPLKSIATIARDEPTEVSLLLMELEKEGLVLSQGNGKGKPRTYAMKSRVNKPTPALATPTSVAGAILTIEPINRPVLKGYADKMRAFRDLCEGTRR